MRCRQFHLPITLEQCCDVMSQFGEVAAPIAGGTDVMVDIRAGKPRYAAIEHLVDVTRIPELHVLEEKNGQLFIGAGVTHADIEFSPLVQKLLPFLSQACGTVGGPQIRSRATIGGNLMTASPAADGVIPLFTLDATAVFKSASGERTEPLSNVLVKPYQTCRKPDEIFTGFKVVLPKGDYSTAFLKIGRRKSLAIARMNLAVIARKKADGSVDYVRLVPGAVFSTAQHLTVVENFLQDKTPDLALLREAGTMAAEAMIGATGRRWSTPYKEPALSALVRRALCQVLEVHDDC